MSQTQREYRVSLKRAYWAARTRRAKRAVRIIKEFVARHLRLEEAKVKLDPEVNAYIWSRSLEKPPRVIDIVVERREDGSVLVKLKK
ncbi:MAG: 50S ribosomal protein L31e [Thermoproteus sp. AZ2]|jgi:large subunit ribosomal protein L31e|uniref:50S ribosomal protein L31e n=1 Tax=Thermoproteus sp. AZ2 TaxID=1609232 RepID=A0ACC6UYC6_9CREN|nr:MAG: 50S ribosomal protein L31 [Thermoproteus sp. AZ2]